MIYEFLNFPNLNLTYFFKIDKNFECVKLKLQGKKLDEFITEKHRHFFAKL